MEFLVPQRVDAAGRGSELLQTLIFGEDVVLYEPEEDGPPADVSNAQQNVSVLVKLIGGVFVHCSQTVT